MKLPGWLNLTTLGRKFSLAFGTINLGFILALLDKDLSGFALVAGAALAFYNGANVAQKVMSNRGGNTNGDNPNG